MAVSRHLHFLVNTHPLESWLLKLLRLLLHHLGVVEEGVYLLHRLVGVHMHARHAHRVHRVHRVHLHAHRVHLHVRQHAGCETHEFDGVDLLEVENAYSEVSPQETGRSLGYQGIIQ